MDEDQGISVNEVRNIATHLGIVMKTGREGEAPTLMQLYELCMYFFNKGRHGQR